MIFLHIGTDKTGSTAIQKLLHWNRAALLDAGLVYPASGTMHYDHARLKIALDNQDEGPWEALRQEVGAHPAHDVVLSHEGFYHLRAEGLGRLKQWLPAGEVRIILYLRRQDDMIESGLLQQIKAGEIEPDLFELDDAEMPFYGHLRYDEIIQRWGDAFGQQKLRVRPYGRAVFSDDKAIFRDFLECLDRGEELLSRLQLPLGDPNPSLDAASAWLIVFLKNLGLKGEQHDSLAGILLSYQARFGRSSARLFTGSQRRRLLDQYSPSNERLSGLPEGFFSPSGVEETPRVSEKEVEARFAFLLDSRKYLVGVRAWYGEGAFPHLVRANYIRLVKGFWKLEEWGVWTKGDTPAVLVFRVPQTIIGRLRIRVAVRYLKGASTRGRIRAVGGAWQPLEDATELVVEPDLYQQNLRLVFLELAHEKPQSPLDVGASGHDSRVVGGGIAGLTYQEAPVG